jgi:hypothetical protein
MVLAAVVGFTLADEADVYLKDGRRLHGEVTETETHVIIRTPAGELPPIPKDQVLRVVRRTTPDGEYRQRVEALAPDDIEGHFEVARWATEIERWDLVVKQCKYILALKPEHRNAKILLENARKQQAGEEEEEAPEEGEADAAPGAPLQPPPKMSDEDIKRIKLSELSFTGDEEYIRVQFKRVRGEPDLPRRVAEELRGREGYDAAWEREFLRMRTDEQLREIVAATGLKYVDRIDLNGDPAKFATFRRNVLPMLNRDCLRSGCHGANGKGFVVPIGSKQSEEYAYTVFHLLDSIETRRGPLINRDHPRDSVLLSYLLPLDEATLVGEGSNIQHPNVKRFRPAVRSRDDRSYQIVQDWINSLAMPRPNYGLSYKLPDYVRTSPTPQPPAFAPPEGEPTTRPAATQEGPADDGGG